MCKAATKQASASCAQNSRLLIVKPAADRSRRSVMEGKKRLSATAAAWCLLAVLLLSGQQLQPVAAMSEFCRCYKQCYADCRIYSGPYPCNFECLQDCINGDQLPPARPKSAADCDRICQSKSICGVMSTDTAVAGGDAQACVVDCRNSIGHSDPPKDTAN